VRGQVRARSVVVEGELHGEVWAEHQAVIRTGGRMYGEIRAPRVALEDGCAFNGTVDMDPAASAAPPPAARPAVATGSEAPAELAGAGAAPAGVPGEGQA
jgi:cytoskeletal protein CcmA (bactofilin family)